MPSNRGHRNFARNMGIDDNGVSSLLDRAGRQYGPNHRKVGHTLNDAAMLLAVNHKLTPDDLRDAALHIQLDTSVSRLPAARRRLLIAMLEEL